VPNINDVNPDDEEGEGSKIGHLGAAAVTRRGRGKESLEQR